MERQRNIEKYNPKIGILKIDGYGKDDLAHAQVAALGFLDQVRADTLRFCGGFERGPLLYGMSVNETEFVASCGHDAIFGEWAGADGEVVSFALLVIFFH